MEATKTEVPKSKRRRTGAARRNRARQYKSGDTNNVVKPVGADSRVARFIKQVVEQKSSKKPKDQQALVPVVATAKKGNKSAKVQEAIKSQAFNIVRQKLVASLMQILPQTNEGNWNDGNNQAPMGAWSNNNNNNNNNNNMNNGGWGNNNNNNNNMNMNNGGGFWSNNNNNNNNMTRGGPNMQGQGGWNNNTNNNLDRGVMNSQGGRNNNRVPANSKGVWNSNNNNTNNNNIGHAKPNSGGMWSSSSNSNLNFDARNNMPNAWSSNLQRSQLTMNNNNNNSNTSVWDAQCPVAPAPPRWNHNLENSTLRNAGHMNQNQNINLSGGGGGDWNGSGLQSNSMWGGKWTDDPRNAGGREYFQDQQTGGNDNYVNDQQNDDEYNQSSAELKFAIMDMNMPGGKILGRRQQLLKAAFNKALVDVVLNADRRFPPIQIKFSRFIQDIYKISVASRGCVEVLQNLVDRLPALWPGSKLRLVAFQPRVKLQKASLFIRSGAVGRSSEEIFLIIERQNTGLTTDKWHVFHTKERDDGVLLIVGIDKQSFDYLERCEGRVFFLTSNAIFKLFKKPTGAVSNGGTGNNPSPKTKPRNRTKKEKGTMA